MKAKQAEIELEQKLLRETAELTKVFVTSYLILLSSFHLKYLYMSQYCHCTMSSDYKDNYYISTWPLKVVA